MLGDTAYVHSGKVCTPPLPNPIGPPTAARYVNVQLLSSPDDQIVYARVLNLGQGLGKGVFVPLQLGDEVLVLFPDGDKNRAVALGGLGSALAANPLDNTGLQALLIHPAGVKLQSVDGLPLHGLVHGQFLVDLNTYLSALQTYLAAVAVAVNAAAVAAAVPPIVPLAQTTFDTAHSVFGNAVNASALSGIAPGIGGAPHATSLHKASP